MLPHPIVRSIKEFWERYFQHLYDEFSFEMGFVEDCIEEFEEEGYEHFRTMRDTDFGSSGSEYVFVAEYEHYEKHYRRLRKCRRLPRIEKENVDDIVDRYQERDGLYWAEGGRYWDKGKYHIESCCNCGDYPNGVIITSGQNEFWNCWDLDEDEQRGETHLFNCFGCYYNRLIATKILQKNWRKCRWNPEYKMCEKVQLRNLERETGVQL